MEELYQLAAQGADFNVVDELGMTPLMKAAMKNDIQLLSFMIKQTREINLEDKEGNSALYYATKENNLDAVKLLHENGATVTDFIYMIALHNNFKTITKYFDSHNRNLVF
jgi:ankyrin repeat protein